MARAPRGAGVPRRGRASGPRGGRGPPRAAAPERSLRRGHPERLRPEAVARRRGGRRGSPVLQLRVWDSRDTPPPAPPRRLRPRGGVHSRSREGATEPQTFADSRGRRRPQPDSSRGAHLSCGRAFVPEVPARAPDLLKEKHVGRGRGPHEAPGAPAHTRGPDLWRENEAASPRAWRPAKPLCWRHLQSPPRTGCLSPKPPHPEDSPPSRRLRRRSPLRSIGCTAAPEGQTPFGLGKRAPRVILESLGRWRPEVGRRPPRRTYPVAGVRAAVPSRAQAWEAEEPLEEKGSQKLNLPRPKAQRPARGAARTQAPPTKAVGAQPGKEASSIENLRGATLRALGCTFSSLCFYPPNPISPSNLNGRVRENAQFEGGENKVARVNQLVGVAKRFLAAKNQTVSLINKLFFLICTFTSEWEGGFAKKATTTVKV
ncbi:unnamed protein product [Nyctereutes procyonoides]|uniref:(raccoon dog) hypothetical protein n=1 Tax=Nyctereutes procyonoides TaxID=34880 RepID=A0A811ZB86_NYCPR|nr:unnamed protein product [Nyctereutes procyonoides]